MINMMQEEITYLRDENEKQKKLIEELTARNNEDEEAYVVNDVLVFFTTKMNKLLKTEMLGLYYSKEKIRKAKALPYKECEKREAVEDGLIYEERRLSMDLEDIYTYIVWLQNKEESDGMPKFASANADNRPAIDNKWVDATVISENVKKLKNGSKAQRK